MCAVHIFVSYHKLPSVKVTYCCTKLSVIVIELNLQMSMSSTCWNLIKLHFTGIVSLSTIKCSVNLIWLFPLSHWIHVYVYVCLQVEALNGLHRLMVPRDDKSNGLGTDQRTTTGVYVLRVFPFMPLCSWSYSMCCFCLLFSQLGFCLMVGFSQ